jgi:hypothetical protein
MKKPIVAVLVGLLLFNICAFSYSEVQNATVQENILLVSDTAVASADYQTMAVVEFNDITPTAAPQSVIVQSDISRVNKDICGQLVDNGAVIIFSNNSLEQVEAKMNGQAIPDKEVGQYTLGAFVCKTTYGYEYGEIAYAHAQESTVFAKPQITSQTFESIRDNLGVSNNTAQPAAANSNGPYKMYNFTVNLLRDGETIGQTWCRQYVYKRAEYMQDGMRKSLWDIVSLMRVTPYSPWGVEEYDTRIHCNAGNQECIEDTYLQSDGTYSDTLNIGITGGANTLEGNIGYSYNHSYSSDSQTITNHLPYGNIKEWYVEVIPWREAHSWQIEPAIRFINHNDQNMSGAWSQITRVKLRKFAIIGIDSNYNLDSGDYDCGDWFS